MEAARHLKPVQNLNPATGELVEEHPAETKLKMLARELDGYRLRLAAAEAAVKRFQVVDPGADQVKTVGSYWQRRVVEESWWSRTPAFRQGTKGWGAVSARLKEPEYDVDYCLVVVDGAMMQPKQGLKREWLTADSIFASHNIEKHFERAQDPKMVRVPAWMELARACRVADAPLLASKCECGHLRLEHSKLLLDGPMQGWEPCMACDCCMDFGEAA